MSVYSLGGRIVYGGASDLVDRDGCTGAGHMALRRTAFYWFLKTDRLNVREFGDRRLGMRLGQGMVEGIPW